MKKIIVIRIINQINEKLKNKFKVSQKLQQNIEQHPNIKTITIKPYLVHSSDNSTRKRRQSK